MIPDETFVDKHYKMNPETEFRIDNGAYLEDGMVVLLADPENRQEFFDGMSESEKKNARIWNRWARISNVLVQNKKYYPAFVTFTAEYEDGSKRVREEHLDQSWLVKIDSAPHHDRMKSRFELLQTILLKLYKISPADASRHAMMIVKRMEEVDRAQK